MGVEDVVFMPMSLFCRGYWNWPLGGHFDGWKCVVVCGDNISASILQNVLEKSIMGVEEVVFMPMLLFLGRYINWALGGHLDLYIYSWYGHYLSMRKSRWILHHLCYE